MKKHELIAMKLKSDKPMDGTEIDDLITKMGRPSMTGSFDDAKNSITSMLNGLTDDKSGDKSMNDDQDNKDQENTDDSDSNQMDDSKKMDDESSKIMDAVKNNDLYLIIGDEVINDPKRILDLILKNEDAFDGGSDDSSEDDHSKTGDNNSY